MYMAMTVTGSLCEPTGHPQEKDLCDVSVHVDIVSCLSTMALGTLLLLASPLLLSLYLFLILCVVHFFSISYRDILPVCCTHTPIHGDLLCGLMERPNQ